MAPPIPMRSPPVVAPTPPKKKAIVCRRQNSKKILHHTILGSGFKYVLFFSPLLGEMIQFD